MLPTIRSRVRRVGLKVPSIEDVAELLVTRDGVERSLALRVAAEAQSHIGMARRLALSSEARARRRDVLVAAMSIRTVTDAVQTSERWLDLARRDAEALTKERDEQEKADLLYSMGLAPGDAVPAAMKSEMKRLTDAQSKRATRSLRDGLDRILVDLLALMRDVLSVQIQASAALVNADLADQIHALAAATKPEQTLAKIAAIEQARDRIDRNVRDQMVLDSLAVALQLPR